MSPDHDAALLAEVSSHLRGVKDSPPLTASRIAEGALEVVPEAGHAGLTVRRGKSHWSSLGVTSELAQEVDQAQYSLGEGPCLDAAEHQEWFRSGDIGSDPRWPRWGPRAARLGVRSMLSIRLLAEGASDGSLREVEDTVGAAATIFGAVTMAGLGTLVTAPNTDVDQIVETAQSVLLTGLTAPRRTRQK